MALHPGWHRVLWDDAGLRNACRHTSSKALAAYDAATVMHQKIDLGRMCALWCHGGAFMDMDVLPLKPLESIPGLVDADRLVVSASALGPFEQTIMRMLHQGDHALTNAFLLAPPQDPALLFIIHYCCDKILSDGSARGTDWSIIAKTTGPAVVGAAVANLPSANMVQILDSRYFEPCIAFNRRCKPHADSVVYHTHSGTWIPNALTKLFVAYYEVKHYVTQLALPLLLLLLFFAVWYFRLRRW